MYFSIHLIGWETEKVMAGPSVHLDDAVQLRTSATFWNKGCKYGPCGELFFLCRKSRMVLSGISSALRARAHAGSESRLGRRRRNYEFDRHSELAWTPPGTMMLSDRKGNIQGKWA